MPEGDTIFRAARALHRALAGRTVTRFETVFPALSRVDVDTPVAGRTVEQVEARGKHLLIRFSGDLILRTHMRMHGSWHLYRAHERWRRPRRDMRIVLETDEFLAVGFLVPIAEFATSASLQRQPAMQNLGPDPLSAEFDAGAAAARLMSRTRTQIADALLDQSAISGIGNVYKSEVLFAGRVNPFVEVGELAQRDVERLVATAVRFMRANVTEGASASIETYRGLRRTTGRTDPGARLWVYGRASRPCRRCGTPISRRKQGPHARTTYWCPRCQPARSD